MANDLPLASEVLQDIGVKFSFPNLRNLSQSDITYPEFLACVSQRLLLKQYTAQTMDVRNLLCQKSTTSDVFNKNKEGFRSGINELFLKNQTLSVINSQASKNKVTKGEQEKVALEFVKWYDSMWFNRLKSEKMLDGLLDAFSDAEPPTKAQGSDDWETLRTIYTNVKDDSVFDSIGIDSKIFVNRGENIQPQWFDSILSDLQKFMEMTGTVDIPAFENLISDEDLIVPTTSAFMISTIYGIEEIEDRKKRYNAPFDPYNMFYTFRETSMAHLLRANQFMFTLYNYFKILL